MTSKQHSQLHGISKGGAQFSLSGDFPVKSGSRIYFINVRIHLLLFSSKLCSVPDFGDFCSWKHNFGVGMYVMRTKFFSEDGVQMIVVFFSLVYNALLMCFYIFFLFTMFPQRSTTDAQLRAPLLRIQSYQKVSLLKPSVGQNIASCSEYNFSFCVNGQEICIPDSFKLISPNPHQT